MTLLHRPLEIPYDRDDFGSSKIRNFQVFEGEIQCLNFIDITELDVGSAIGYGDSL